jgi:hypothetical protein
MGMIKVKVIEKQILEYKNGENKSNWGEKNGILGFWGWKKINKNS